MVKLFKDFLIVFLSLLGAQVAVADDIIPGSNPLGDNCYIAYNAETGAISIEEYPRRIVLEWRDKDGNFLGLYLLAPCYPTGSLLPVSNMATDSRPEDK
ncbi:MAG: hypothetical protein K1X79_07265 [Oligoflexia bacterium]|nr:hypothetical protein [Oligoflexia bacterium]